MTMTVKSVMLCTNLPMFWRNELPLSSAYRTVATGPHSRGSLLVAEPVTLTVPMTSCIHFLAQLAACFNLGSLFGSEDGDKAFL